jgi:hypothetical protein
MHYCSFAAGTVLRFLKKPLSGELKSDGQAQN